MSKKKKILLILSPVLLPLLLMVVLFVYMLWGSRNVFTTGTVEKLEEIELLVPFLKQAQQEAIPMEGPFSYCIAENRYYILIAVTGKMSAETFEDSVLNDCLYNDQADEKICTCEIDFDRYLSILYNQDASLARFNFLDELCIYRLMPFDCYRRGGHLYVGICEEGCMLYASGSTGRKF